MIFDFFVLAFRSLRGRILRTILTMIGIFIGVASVVALISLGQGMRDAISASFASVGSDKILIQPASPGFGPPGQDSIGIISDDDIKIIKSISGVNRVGGRLLRSANIKIGGDNSRTVFSASLPSDAEARDLIIEANAMKIFSGRMLKSSDNRKILLGSSLWDDSSLRGGVAVGLNSKVSVNGIFFDVAGLLSSSGGPRDSIVVMNEDDMRDIFGSDKELSVIAVQVSSNADVDLVAEKISRALRRDRGQMEGFEDFTISTSVEIIESVNTVVSVVQAVFIGIAFISLIVGGIGITNTMYTSVLEQSKNIGVMKSVGARNGDILWIFLFESGILGLVGGFIGVIIGAILSKIVEFSVRGFLGDILRASLPWYVIVGALVFSFCVGVASGVLPAIQASRLPPVEALML